MTSNGGWRQAAVVPFLVLTAISASAEEAAKPTGTGRVAVPIESAPEPEASAQSSSVPEFLRAFGVETWWDVARPGLLSGEIGLLFDDQEQNVRSPGSPNQRFASRILNETIGVRNDGLAIVDPRLVLGNIAVGVTLDQEWQDSLDAASKQHGTLYNYAIDFSALPESPYITKVFANQTQTTYVLPSGTTTHSDIMNRGISFRLREDSILREKEILPYFSANVRAQQQYDKQTTTNAGQTFRQDDRRDTVTLDLQNGTERSDLSLQYQYTNLDNFVYEPGSYHGQTTNAMYSIDFGPMRNWRSDSHLNYYTRSGRDPTSDLTNLDATEFLTIDHNADTSSYYSYQLTHQEAASGNTTSHNAQAQLHHQFYRNFSGSGSVLGSYSSFPTGDIKSGGVSGSLNYNHTLPWSGNVYANAGGGYLVTSSQVIGGVVQVTDAPYQVPSVIGAGSEILLKDRNIAAPSIQVVVIKGGTRVAAILDTDYNVRVNGDRTSIVPLATSAVMLPGDPLEISYTYEVSPDSKFQTVSNSGSLSLEWPWVGLTVSHDQTKQTPLAGSDASLLTDERRNAAQMFVRGIWEEWQARFNAGVLDYDSDRLAYREVRLGQLVTYRPSPTLQVNLNGDQYRTAYSVPTHTTKGASARLDVQWTVGAWLTSAYAGWRTYRDTLQPTERIFEGEVRVRRTWTKLDLNFALAVQNRKRGDVDSLNAIVHLGLVRRF